MKKETEDLLRNYWHEGYRFIQITTDKEIFITKNLKGFDTHSDLLFNLKGEEAVYLPINELKSLFSDNIRSAIIDREINVVN